MNSIEAGSYVVAIATLVDCSERSENKASRKPQKLKVEIYTHRRPNICAVTALPR